MIFRGCFMTPGEVSTLFAALPAQGEPERTEKGRLLKALCRVDERFQLLNSPAPDRFVLCCQTPAALDDLVVYVQSFQLASEPRLTLAAPVVEHGRYVRQSGPLAKFGDVTLEFAPQTQSQMLTFDFWQVDVLDDTRAIDRVDLPDYLAAIVDGVLDAAFDSDLEHCLTDLHTTLRTLRYHPIASAPLHFRVAGGLAMRGAIARVGISLLETP